jgi:predicted nucleotidyltransferase
MLSRINNPLDRVERLARVDTYLHALGLQRYRAILFGSVARGDYTADSDTDLLVISDELPIDRKERLDLLFVARDVAPEIEPIGWTEAEWQRRRALDDPFLDVLQREGQRIEAPIGLGSHIFASFNGVGLDDALPEPQDQVASQKVLKT